MVVSVINFEGDQDGEAAIRVLSALVSQPAEQSDLFEADPQVQAYLSGPVTELAQEVGLPVQRGPMGSVVIRLGTDRGSKRCLLFAYAMTHPTGRMRDAHSPTVSRGQEGVRVRGRGTSEQKGALAASLLAMSQLRQYQEELDGEVVLCVSPAGETGRHDAATAFMDGESRSFDWSIVCIGTNSQPCMANKGRIDMTVTVTGRSAHSSTPWSGLNAVTGARQVLDRLDAIQLRGKHPHLGEPTLTVTALHSFPPATHTVPDEVQITLDRRLLPGQTPDAAVDEIARAVGAMSPFGVEVVSGPFMYPSEVDDDSNVVRVLDEAHRQLGIANPGRRYSHGALDAGYFNHVGIPAVMFGPGDQGTWHTDEESILIEDVLSAAAVYGTAALLQTRGS